MDEPAKFNEEIAGTPPVDDPTGGRAQDVASREGGIEAPPTFEAGVILGDFRIERRIGTGGMGVVYEARQLSLDRAVALKVLGPAMNRPNDIARFRREAQAVARLRHPGIAGIYYVGQDERLCYLAIEFVDGVPVRTVIERLRAARDPRLSLEAAFHQLPFGEEATRAIRFDESTEALVAETKPIEPDASPYVLGPAALALVASPEYFRRCARLIEGAAEALAHAHNHGVVHRDVKPENLLLDRHGRLHLIDFGIARFFEDVTLTQTGQLVGTPMYMSPEQVTGRLIVDHRTDIYSLGLVLYELLTLHFPITASTREGVLRQVVTKALVPVSWGNRAVPRQLEAVVHRAIAKDPDERYQSAGEFAGDLANFLADRPVAAPPYRYRFDRREIAAERPQATTLFGIMHLMLGLYFVTQGLPSLQMLIIMIRLGVQSNVVFHEVVLLSSTALALTSTAVGVGLLGGRAVTARWTIVVDIGIIFFLALFVYNTVIYLLIYPPSAKLETWPLLVPYLPIWMSIVALCALSITWFTRPRSREWFIFAERLRREYERQANAAR